MKYMRVNYVDAEPMKFGEFKAKFPTSGGANLTRPDDDEGYVITYRKGPKRIRFMVSGGRVRCGQHAGARGRNVFRHGDLRLPLQWPEDSAQNWNGVGQYVEYRKCATLNTEGIDEHSKCFVFHFVNRKTGETGIQVGWLASQADLAAGDWVVIDE